MTLNEPNAVRPRKIAVLIPSSQITALVKGGKLSVISLPVLRIKLSPSSWLQRSGTGTTGKLRCPSLSTARTAKITLSLDNFSVARVSFDQLRMFPIRRAGGSPDDLVGC